MKIRLAILYTLTGFVLALPYCFLAGWNTRSYALVALLAPVFLFVWIFFAGLSGLFSVGYHDRKRIYLNWFVIFNKVGRRIPGSLMLFWVWTLCGLLPIILHWCAFLFNRIGHLSIGETIDAHRYASPVYLFIVSLVLIIMIDKAYNAWETMKGEK